MRFFRIGAKFRNLFLNPPFLDFIILAVLEKLGREKIEEATLVLPRIMAGKTLVALASVHVGGLPSRNPC